MNLIIRNNHLLVELKTNNGHGLFMIDTGFPSSITNQNSINTVTINDEQIPVYYNQQAKIACNQARILTGEDVVGFIGMNVLNQTGLTINYSAKTVDFNVTKGHILAFLKDYDSQLKTAYGLVVNGQELSNAYIDTGAYISYVAGGYLDGCKETSETYIDYNPVIGEIKGNYVLTRLDKVTLGSGDYGHEIKVGIRPESPLVNNIDAFFNPYDLVVNEEKLAPTQSISFDFKDECIYIF